MKTIKIYLTAFAFAAAVFTSLALVQDSKPKVYDYVFFRQEGCDVHIYKSDGTEEKTDAKCKDFCFEEMKQIIRFEKEGYELVTSYSDVALDRHILRREHKE